MSINIGNTRRMSEGTKHFLLQRVSAILNIPLTIFLLIVIFNLPGMSYSEITQCINNPFITILLLILFINYSLHMKLGMQTIIEDYIHGPKELRAALILNRLVYYTVIIVSILSLIIVLL